jgi:hypothetical protein
VGGGRLLVELQAEMLPAERGRRQGHVGLDHVQQGDGRAGALGDGQRLGQSMLGHGRAVERDDDVAQRARLAGHEHRAGSAAHHLFGDAAHRPAGQAGAAVGAHDNGVHLARARQVDNLAGRVAGADFWPEGDAGPGPAAGNLVEVVGGVLAGAVFRLVGVPPVEAAAKAAAAHGA